MIAYTNLRYLSTLRAFISEPDSSFYWLGPNGLFPADDFVLSTKYLVQLLNGKMPDGKQLKRNRIPLNEVEKPNLLQRLLRKDKHLGTIITIKTPLWQSLNPCGGNSVTDFIQQKMVHKDNDHDVKIVLAAVFYIENDRFITHFIIPNMCQLKDGTYSTVEIDYGSDNSNLDTLYKIYANDQEDQQ